MKGPLDGRGFQAGRWETSRDSDSWRTLYRPECGCGGNHAGPRQGQAHLGSSSGLSHLKLLIKPFSRHPRSWVVVPVGSSQPPCVLAPRKDVGVPLSEEFWPRASSLSVWLWAAGRPGRDAATRVSSAGPPGADGNDCAVSRGDCLWGTQPCCPGSPLI